MLYPLKFIPVFKNYIWGGRNLVDLGKKIPDGKVAESWEICCHSDGMSKVSKGRLAGKTLGFLVKEHGADLMGTTFRKGYSTFPLMVKLIDANDSLSVQVHPDDTYAKVHDGESGKNEMWYILRAKPGASLIYDVRPGVTKEAFERAVAENRIGECLRSVPVKAGDFVYIPAGMVHAIGEGIVLAEIQQNSNATYRIFDYNRTDASGKPRPLHIKKAMDVMQFHTEGRKLKEGLEYSLPDGGTIKVLVANPHFCVELFNIQKTVSHQTDGVFHIWLCISGSGFFEGEMGRVSITMGETVLIPSCMGNYFLNGPMKVLKTYIPDVQKNIYERLLGKGFSKEEIREKIDGIQDSK